MAGRLPAPPGVIAKYRQRVQMVVGAAIVRDGRVLAARRTSPAESAGRWEFPGGKVEPGESMGDALTREIREELDCEIEVVNWLPGSLRLTSELSLSVAQAVVVEGEPNTSTDHDELRWLGVDELNAVPWLDADLTFVASMRAILSATLDADALRGIVFEESDALAVATALHQSGYHAHVVRERLAGEDDDEGHPWAIVTDAPAVLLEVLIDDFDGWVDLPEPTPPRPPLSLPPGPKKLKREH